MTTQMVKRVARAIREKINTGAKSRHGTATFEDLARAALAAIREPDEAMLQAARNSRLTHNAVILPLWRVMIDAALAEPDPDP